jgi:hypothetical protein
MELSQTVLDASKNISAIRILAQTLDAKCREDIPSCYAKLPEKPA